MKKLALFPIALIALIVAGCGGNDDPTVEVPNPPTPKPTAQLPADLFLAAAPEGAAPVATIKAEKAVGDDVVMTVVVGGRKKPMVAGRAMFTAVEASVDNRCTTEDDHCETPWDYCCETDLGINTVTIQIVGDDGKPLALDLADSKIKPLSKLVVKGTISQKPTAETIIVDATGVFVE